MGAPEQLDRYRLLSTLGSGGFGEVYLGLDPEGHTVAIKVLHPHVAADSLALARLAREVETMRRVRGPHVAEILDASLTGPRPYLVTRYIQGRPLSTVIAEDGPIQGDGLVRLARGLARALASIHAAGVVHRDLKPANVLMGAKGPVLIDFGIAHVMDATRVTDTGAFLGTPGYAAPELFAGEPVGEPADLHAWGATVAFAATGRPTFGRGSAEAQMYAILHGQADLAGVPAALLPHIRAALHREPAKRPTAALLAARLDRLVRAASAPEEARSSRGRRRALPRDSRGRGRTVREAAPLADGARAETPQPDAPRDPDGVPAAAEGVRAAAAAEAAREPGGREAAVREPVAREAVREPGAREQLREAARETAREAGVRDAAGRRDPGGTRGAARVRPRRRAVGAAQLGDPAEPLASESASGGQAALFLLAILAVPSVVASVLWAPATFLVTAGSGVLARALWSGHRLLRRRRPGAARMLLRVLTFPVMLAGSLVTAVVWPGLPAGASAALSFWLASGLRVPQDWWNLPGPVTLAGVVFGIVCGGVIGREVERAGRRMPELRKEGLRALALLGGFVAVCAAAVRAVAVFF